MDEVKGGAVEQVVERGCAVSEVAGDQHQIFVNLEGAVLEATACTSR
jgi:hypothetical protein